MPIRSLIPGVLVALAPASADAPPAAGLAAAPAIAVVQPVAPGQRLIRLPALEYTITVETDCGALLEAHTASLSIADTSLILDAKALEASPVTVQVTVPRAQVAPVAVEGFCQAGEPVAREALHTRVDDAVTAHLSLHCSGEERQAVVYASKPLGVVIECAPAQAPPEPAATR